MTQEQITQLIQMTLIGGYIFVLVSLAFVITDIRTCKASDKATIGTLISECKPVLIYALLHTIFCTIVLYIANA